MSEKKLKMTTFAASLGIMPTETPLKRHAERIFLRNYISLVIRYVHTAHLLNHVITVREWDRSTHIDIINRFNLDANSFASQLPVPEQIAT